MTISKTITHQAEATRGAAKRMFGRATGNSRLRVEGRMEQAKANAKQSGAKLKDVFKP
jgi:uncharacterized protein YjbJ (UPF0337 family)